MDGRFYEGIDHEEALKAAKCPMLVMHADWHRYAEYGLVGAMDDKDAQRITKLVPNAKYKNISANHVIHAFKPKEYISAIEEFTSQLK